MLQITNHHIIFSTLTALLFCLPQTALAHSGGLDGSGGHRDHINGGYHKHPERQNSPRQTYNSPTNTYRRQGVYQPGTIVITYPKKKKTEIHNVKVVGFVDGDSIKVILDGKQVDIRLYGIDCPESGQAYGQSATAGIKEILTGRKIQIKIITYDRYGRAVAMVYADRKNVNEIMVKAGLAWVYRKYCKDDFCNDWLKLEKEAKSKNWRLWKDADPTPPWLWRKE